MKSLEKITPLQKILFMVTKNNAQFLAIMYFEAPKSTETSL